MVKCSVLLLVVSILLVVCSLEITFASGAGTQSGQTTPSNTGGDVDSAVPIHRVILLIEPVMARSDPLVTTLYNKTIAKKAENKRKRSLSRPKLPGDVNTTPTFAIPGTSPIKPPPDPAESISAQQLTALADLYLTDDIKVRLRITYRISVVDDKEVDSAMS